MGDKTHLHPKQATKLLIIDAAARKYNSRTLDHKSRCDLLDNNLREHCRRIVKPSGFGGLTCLNEDSPVSIPPTTDNADEKSDYSGNIEVNAPSAFSEQRFNKDPRDVSPVYKQRYRPYYRMSLQRFGYNMEACQAAHRLCVLYNG